MPVPATTSRPSSPKIEASSWSGKTNAIRMSATLWPSVDGQPAELQPADQERPGGEREEPERQGIGDRTQDDPRRAFHHRRIGDVGTHATTSACGAACFIRLRSQASCCDVSPSQRPTTAISS